MVRFLWWYISIAYLCLFILVLTLNIYQLRVSTNIEWEFCISCLWEPSLYTYISWLYVHLLLFSISALKNKTWSVWKLSHYWLQPKLSLWQLSLSPVMTKFSNWQSVIFSVELWNYSVDYGISKCIWNFPDHSIHSVIFRPKISRSSKDQETLIMDIFIAKDILSW